MSRWSVLEFFLAQLYGVLVSSRRGSAEAGYGLIIALPTRIEMLKAAIDWVLWPDTHPLVLELITTLNQIAKLGARRNEIAHGMSMGFWGSGVQGVFLSPSTANSKKTDWRSHKAPNPTRSHPFNHFAFVYTSAQIIGYAIVFEDYQSKLGTLIERVQKEFAEKLAHP